MLDELFNKNFKFVISSENMKNNLEKTTNKIKHLAEHHAHEFFLHKQKNNLPAVGEFNLKLIVEAVISLNFFKSFDEAAIRKTIDQLKISINDLLNSNILTQSRVNDKMMPVAFDALVEIFTYSNEKFRRQYFQDLISQYYEELCRNLQALDSKKILDKVDYDLQIKILLPLVKLHVAAKWSKEGITDFQENCELLSNIALYFKFPMINQEDINEVVRNITGSSNFNIKSYELIPLNEKNGHLGEYFKLKILINNKEDLQQFDLFAKFLNPKTEIMKQMALSGPSKKEEFFYITYMPLLEKYGLKSLLSFAPKCYFSRLNDVLILDDMELNGFVGLTPNISLKYDALYKVIEQIAKFHACTMILEEKMSEEKEKRVTVDALFAEFLQEAFFIPDDDYFLKLSFDGGVATIDHIATKFPEITKKYSEQFLRDKINKGWKLHFDKLKKSDLFKNTMCHGDMYVGNMLFKFNDEKIYQDVCLIDFQLLRYCPPTHDLLFFLHQSCTKEVRNKHLVEFCNLYYGELTKHVENFGFDIKKVYPKEDFEESLKYMKSQAVFHALYYSPITMISPKLREDIFSNQEQSDYYLLKYRWRLVDIGLEDEGYRTVIKGLVEDFVELCENDDL